MTACARSTSSRISTATASELPPGAVGGELGDVPWLLEELRISYFAQAVGTRGQISAKKVRRILAEAAVVNDERPAYKGGSFDRFGPQRRPCPLSGPEACWSES